MTSENEAKLEFCEEEIIICVITKESNKMVCFATVLRRTFVLCCPRDSSVNQKSTSWLVFKFFLYGRGGTASRKWKKFEMLNETVEEKKRWWKGSIIARRQKGKYYVLNEAVLKWLWRITKKFERKIFSLKFEVIVNKANCNSTAPPPPRHPNHNEDTQKDLTFSTV